MDEINKRIPINEFARNLNKKLPKSELWFINELSKSKIIIKFSRNKPLEYYIPDLINKQYKIIIEVDGNIHDSKEIQLKDKKKDKFYKAKGYLVIRVKAYDSEEFNKCLSIIKSRIKKRSKQVKKVTARKRYKKWLNDPNPHYINNR